IIYNGFLPGNKFLDFANMFYDAARDKGHTVTLYSNEEVLNQIAGLRTESKPDYVVFTDKDIYLAQELENCGVRVFNKAATIEISDDKIKTYQLLAQAKLAIPQTIVAPKTFGLNQRFSDEYLNRVMNTLTFPFIIKETFGSFGEQV